MTNLKELADRLERFRPGPDDHYLDRAAAALREADAAYQDGYEMCKIEYREKLLVSEAESDARIAELEAALRGLVGEGDEPGAIHLQGEPWDTDEYRIARAALEGKG